MSKQYNQLYQLHQEVFNYVKNSGPTKVTYRDIIANTSANSIGSAQFAIKNLLSNGFLIQTARSKYESPLTDIQPMERYKPSLTPSYIIESDGDSWFCHDSTFANAVESSEVFFAPTPKEALDGFLNKYRLEPDS